MTIRANNDIYENVRLGGGRFEGNAFENDVLPEGARINRIKGSPVNSVTSASRNPDFPSEEGWVEFFERGVNYINVFDGRFSLPPLQFEQLGEPNRVGEYKTFLNYGIADADGNESRALVVRVFDVDSPPLPPPGFDDYPDIGTDPNEYPELSLNTPIEGKLERVDDSDAFKIELEEGVPYKISLAPISEDLVFQRAQIYKSDFTTDPVGSPNKVFLEEVDGKYEFIYTPESSGTYYIAADSLTFFGSGDVSEGTTGEYSLTASVVPNVDPVAVDDVIERIEGEYLVKNVLFNDTDPDSTVGGLKIVGIDDQLGFDRFEQVTDGDFLEAYGGTWYELGRDGVRFNEDGRVATLVEGSADATAFGYLVGDNRDGIAVGRVELTAVEAVVEPDPIEPDPVDPIDPVDPVDPDPVDPVDPITGEPTVTDSLIRVRGYKGGGVDKLQFKGINAMGDYTFMLNESLDNKGDDILTGQNYKIGLGVKGDEENLIFSETFGLKDGERAVVALEGDEIFNFISETGASKYKAHVIDADTNEVMMSIGVGDLTKETSDPFENKLFNWGFDQPVYAVDQTFI